LARTTLVAGIGGIAAGVVVAGVGGRIFMRIAGAAGGAVAAGRTTEAGFTVGEITLGGTLTLVIFVGLAAGLVGAVIYVAMSPWLSWAGRWRGAAFGVMLFALASATSDIMNPDNFDFRILGNGPLLVALVAGLFVAFGMVADAVSRKVDPRLPHHQPNEPAGIIYVVLVSVAAVMAVPLTGVILFSTSSCSCAIPYGASWSFVVVFLATFALWITVLLPTPLWVSRIATLAGIAGMTGIIGFGLSRAVSDAIDIIQLA
jgi:hypothetical protein